MPSVQPEWCLSLPIQQQSVLILAARGPDGINKDHPCKDVQRAYRGTVLVAAKYGRLLEIGEKGDSFMSLDLFDEYWATLINRYYRTIDDLPHHFVMHLLHGAEILGYKHPDFRFRERWFDFYSQGVVDMHLVRESEHDMDLRLSDWGQKEWL